MRTPGPHSDWISVGSQLSAVLRTRNHFGCVIADLKDRTASTRSRRERRHDATADTQK
jgi:hypothetical protein